MNEKIVKILDELIKDIKRKEEHTYEQIGFCNTHKFEIEREALRYQQQAYNSCLVDLTDARERIVELMNKTLEVKEVNLEKEIELIKGDYEQVDVAWNNDFDFIAKHFFEIGLKMKGGEE